MGARSAAADGCKEKQIQSDSQLQVRQLSDEYRVTMRNSKAFLVERWKFCVSSIAIVPIYIIVTNKLADRLAD
jgi:hypothetical protein